MKQIKIINLNEITHHDLLSSNSGETYSKSVVLTEFFDFENIFVHHEILLPGKRSSAPHYHTLREEMVVVLSGLPTCYLGKQKIQMKSGDVIGFKPGLAESHYFKNLSEKIVYLLVICSNHPKDRTIFN